MQDQQRKNQLISAWPQDLNQVLPLWQGEGGGYSIYRLIADHQQLTGRDIVLSPVVTQQDNKDN